MYVFRSLFYICIIVGISNNSSTALINSDILVQKVTAEKKAATRITNLVIYKCEFQCRLKYIARLYIPLIFTINNDLNLPRVTQSRFTGISQWLTV